MDGFVNFIIEHYIIFDMKIKEYIPGYFSGFDKHASDFSTKEDLLNIDWIKCESDREGFSGYMVDGDCLVSTYNYNTNKKPSWYVIGYFDDNETVNCIKKWFPHWGHPKYIMNNGDVVEIQLTYFDKMKINITTSYNDSNLISDYRIMTVSRKWFDENYSHNVFEMS